MSALTGTPRERVEAAILACFDDNYEPAAREAAEVLVDEDVAAGLYEGCSSELEGWFCNFERIAEGVLGR